MPRHVRDMFKKSRRVAVERFCRGPQIVPATERGKERECVCEREGEKEREREIVCMFVCVSVCVRERER